MTIDQQNLGRQTWKFYPTLFWGSHSDFASLPIVYKVAEPGTEIGAENDFSGAE